MERKDVIENGSGNDLLKHGVVLAESEEGKLSSKPSNAINHPYDSDGDSGHCSPSCSSSVTDPEDYLLLIQSDDYDADRESLHEERNPHPIKGVTLSGQDCDLESDYYEDEEINICINKDNKIGYITPEPDRDPFQLGTDILCASPLPVLQLNTEIIARPVASAAPCVLPKTTMVQNLRHACQSTACAAMSYVTASITALALKITLILNGTFTGNEWIIYSAITGVLAFTVSACLIGGTSLLFFAASEFYTHLKQNNKESSTTLHKSSIDTSTEKDFCENQFVNIG